MSEHDEAVSLDEVRSLWQFLETIHLVVYFAPEKRALYEEAGLKGGWMGYFASRAAPLGVVAGEVVHALFFNFHRDMVLRAIPDAWTFSSPERVLKGRTEVVDRALTRMLGELVDSESLYEAALLARELASRCEAYGRPMFAAHARLPWPEGPHLELWHAATLVREYRGDGHVAALVGAGIDGCEAHVLFSATGAVPRVELQSNRGWSDDEWAAAERRLEARGLVEDGTVTATGRALHDDIELKTDELSSRPFAALGPKKVARLRDLLHEPVRRIVAGGGVPFPNPAGLPRFFEDI